MKPTPLTSDEIYHMRDAFEYVDYEFARAIEAEVNARWKKMLAEQEQEPVAYFYTLEYGDKVVDERVSKHQLNYPFGVCGADYLAKNGNGISRIRQTPLYVAPLVHVDLLKKALAQLERRMPPKTDPKVWNPGLHETVSAIKEALK